MYSLIGTLRSIIQFVFGIIELILVTRFIFRLFGAGTTSAFVQWLYGLSAPFVTPFRGIFPDWNISGGGVFFVFEISTLIAIIFYMIVGTLLSDLLWRVGTTRE